MGAANMPEPPTPAGGGAESYTILYHNVLAFYVKM